MTTSRSRMFPVLLALVLGQAPATANDVVPGACVPTQGRPVAPGCVPALTSDLREPGTTLPNLVPDSALPFALRLGDEPALYFDTQIRNEGAVPVDLLVDDLRNPASTTVSQCVSWTGNLVCRERRPVGGFAWHDPHTHFHYQDFARYELRRVADDEILASSDKVSFCLYDVARHDPNAVAAPRYTACTPVQQGISPGWSDIYTPDQAGQSLSLAGVPDGVYALVITLDPADHLYESDNSDNRVTVTFALSGDRTNVTVVNRTWSS